MMTRFDETIASLLAFTAIISALALNLFWIVSVWRRHGHPQKAIRALWIGYLIAPVLMASAFAVSVRLEPLVDFSEEFGGDARPMGYILGWMVLESVISAIGVMIMVAKVYRKQAQPATAPYSEPPARSSQG